MSLLPNFRSDGLVDVLIRCIVTQAAASAA